MPAISHLNPTWEHTLTDILNHDPKTQILTTGPIPAMIDLNHMCVPCYHTRSIQ